MTFCIFLNDQLLCEGFYAENELAAKQVLKNTKKSLQDTFGKAVKFKLDLVQQ